MASKKATEANKVYLRKVAYMEIAEHLRDFVEGGVIDLDLPREDALYVEHVILYEVVPHFVRFAEK